MTNTNSVRHEALRAEIDRLGPWHHDVTVVDGIRTGEVCSTQWSKAQYGEVSLIRPESILPHILGDVYPKGLAGRSVLDCACNAGGYVFAASALGAGRAFGFDVREHWIRQARFLAANLPARNVDFAQCDLANLKSLGLGKFDVTLFMGIFYHLPDPIAGLRIAADQTSELMVVNTAIEPQRRDGLLLNVESDTDVMSGVHGLAWLPTGAPVMQALLAACGFRATRVQFYGTGGGKRRVQILAARDEKLFLHYDSVHPRASEKSGRRWRQWFRAMREAVRR